MSIEVVVYEDGKEVERQNLDQAGYLIFTAENWHVSSMQKWAKSGTAQFTIKRAKSEAPVGETNS